MLPSPEPFVVFQRLGDGAVLFSPVTELYFGLNEVGARIWELLPPASSSFAELCDKLTIDYPDIPRDTIRQDALELLAGLTREKLVAPPPPSLGATAVP